MFGHDLLKTVGYDRELDPATRVDRGQAQVHDFHTQAIYLGQKVAARISRATGAPSPLASLNDFILGVATGCFEKRRRS